MDGFINMNKEKGYTSHDVVAKMRGILKQRKIGHTGTLDPDATGVLPICLGKATKVCDIITDKDKTYQTVCRLGVETDTQDMTGNVIRQSKVSHTEDEVRKAVYSFQGVQEQIPPMYSAIKIEGKRLYELARQGKTVERKPRTVTFHEIHILDLDMDRNLVKMEVSCSKGTYIRTLCHDIGVRLGSGACMEELVRTKVGGFAIEDALTISQVEDAVRNGRLQEWITPIDAIFSTLSSVTIKDEFQKNVWNGGSFFLEHANLEKGANGLEIGQRVKVYDGNGRFIGLYEYHGEKGFRVQKMFFGAESGC